MLLLCKGSVPQLAMAHAIGKVQDDADCQPDDEADPRNEWQADHQVQTYKGGQY